MKKHEHKWEFNFASTTTKGGQLKGMKEDGTHYICKCGKKGYDKTN